MNGYFFTKCFSLLIIRGVWKHRRLHKKEVGFTILDLDNTCSILSIEGISLNIQFLFKGLSNVLITNPTDPLQAKQSYSLYLNNENDYIIIKIICQEKNFGGSPQTRTGNPLLKRQEHLPIVLVTHNLVGVAGLEPTTHSLKGCYSTNWVTHPLVGTVGIEPTNLNCSVLRVHKTLPLSYVPIKDFIFTKFNNNTNIT